jgi:hypothetical protein
MTSGEPFDRGGRGRDEAGDQFHQFHEDKNEVDIANLYAARAHFLKISGPLILADYLLVNLADR